MREFPRSTNKLEITLDRRTQGEDHVTPIELKKYQSLSVKMNWWGLSNVPRYAFCGRLFSAAAGGLKVKNHSQAHKNLLEFEQIEPILVLRRLKKIEKLN